ncbi:MAG: hypothetical protein ABA06_02615 [Parcubacteria bacterium C7867-001]|nr:MAG: hypothetical protein ABA06_02615 [Parcubacteria bacterium C7867-001]
MSHQLTNLLPRDRRRAFRSEYFIRLVTVIIALLGALLVLHAVMLIPSYAFLSQQVDERDHQLQTLSSHLDSTEERETSARLAALATDTKYLARLGSTPTASAAIRAVLAVTPNGITLSGLTFAPPKAGALGRMVLTGSASTREALRAYQAALAALPFVDNADLPIAAFAKDSDIPFTITLTGSLTP